MTHRVRFGVEIDAIPDGVDVTAGACHVTPVANFRELAPIAAEFAGT